MHGGLGAGTSNIGSFMLLEGHFELIMSSLLGSMLVNLLLIFGLAIFTGDHAYPGQKWDVKEMRLLTLGTTFGAVGILVPVRR
jgi:calcium/proton exchanger cax